MLVKIVSSQSCYDDGQYTLQFQNISEEEYSNRYKDISSEINYEETIELSGKLILNIDTLFDDKDLIMINLNIDNKRYLLISGELYDSYRSYQISIPDEMLLFLEYDSYTKFRDKVDKVNCSDLVVKINTFLKSTSIG
jgi:hypothetical protein